jgi:hypothetical protein
MALDGKIMKWREQADELIESAWMGICIGATIGIAIAVCIVIIFVVAVTIGSIAGCCEVPTSTGDQLSKQQLVLPEGSNGGHDVLDRNSDKEPWR